MFICKQVRGTTVGDIAEASNLAAIKLASAPLCSYRFNVLEVTALS